MPSSRRHRRGEHRSAFTPARIRRMEGTVVLLISGLIIVFATLRPVTIAASRFCVACGQHATVDVLANTLLFVPIGAGLALLGVRWRSALIVGAAATILVEALQLALPVGRIASISDLVANLAGTAIGFGVSQRRRALLYPRSRAALRFAMTMSAAWLIIVALSALALQPSLPASEYFGQLTPDLGGFDRYSGQLISAHVSGIPILDGPVARSDIVRDAMARRMRLDVAVIPGQARPRIAPIFRVADREQREILMLAQRGHDLLFRSRAVATDLRLITPTVAMVDAIATAADPADGETILLAAQREAGNLRVAGWGRDATLDLHSGAGWLLLVPAASMLQSSPDPISAFWVGIPLFAVGYWTGRRARRRARRAGDVMRMTGAGGEILRALPMLIAIVAIGLGGISAAFGLSQPSWTVWAGAFTGIIMGLALGATTALAHDDRAHGSVRSDGRSAEVPAVAESATQAR